MWTWLPLLLSCSEPTERVAAVRRPTVAVVVPLTGGNKPIGASAVQGVIAAMDDKFDVQEIDEGGVDPIEEVRAIGDLVGVVAHVTPQAAERFGPRWKESGLPVILATTAMESNPPHILPNAVTLMECSSAFIDAKWIFGTNDGGRAGMEATEQLKRSHGRKMVDARSVDPSQMGVEVERVRRSRSKVVVFSGAAQIGGNFVRTMRLQEIDTDFLGVGLYDQKYLVTAGSAANGSLVTSGDRPALMDDVYRVFETRFGQAPSAPSLNAYDAAMVLRRAFEDAVGSGAQDRAEATRQRLGRVAVNGAAGAFQIGAKGEPEPTWCTGFAVKEDAFQWRGVARHADGETVLETDPAKLKELAEPEPEEEDPEAVAQE